MLSEVAAIQRLMREAEECARDPQRAGSVEALLHDADGRLARLRQVLDAAAAVPAPKAARGASATRAADERPLERAVDAAADRPVREGEAPAVEPERHDGTFTRRPMDGGEARR